MTVGIGSSSASLVVHGLCSANVTGETWTERDRDRDKSGFGVVVECTGMSALARPVLPSRCSHKVRTPMRPFLINVSYLRCVGVGHRRSELVEADKSGFPVTALAGRQWLLQRVFSNVLACSDEVCTPTRPLLANGQRYVASMTPHGQR